MLAIYMRYETDDLICTSLRKQNTMHFYSSAQGLLIITAAYRPYILKARDALGYITVMNTLVLFSDIEMPTLHLVLLEPQQLAERYYVPCA